MKVVGSIEALLFPDLESDWFWFIVGGLLLFSAVGFFFHFGIVKRWHTIAVIDDLMDKWRAKLVEAYFGAKEGGEERNSLFVAPSAATAFGLAGIGSMLLKLAPEESDAAFIVTCLFFLVSLVAGLISAKRQRSGPPERIKPMWLIEEERRRESAGEVLRDGRGWIKNPKLHG